MIFGMIKNGGNLVIRIARLKMLQLGALFQIHTRKYRRKINDKGNSSTKQIKGTQESEEQKVYETAYGCTELLKGKDQ